MPDQNPIYDFMKSNKLTDLDEKTFINKYSAPDKAKEIYSFMASNKLTDLDETKFYDKYLKKKVGGAESSLTELPSKGFSPKQISLLQTGVKPPKPVGKTAGTTIIPTNITPDQKAYERELKRQDAAINTLKNTYSKKGLNFNEKSKRGQEQIAELLDKEINNDLTLVTGKDQKPYLVRGEGFLESAGRGILRSIIDPIESTKINFTNDAVELADLLDEKIKEEPNVPESAPTRVGGYLGELAGGLPKMMALLAIPVAGESAMVGEMYHNALANQRRVLYERGLQEGMDRTTAAQNAMKNAPITAIPDAIVGAALARGVGGKPAGAEIIPNAAKESFLKATGNGLKGVAKVSGIGGAAEFGRSKAEQQLGYNVTDAEAIENGLRGMGEYAIMDAAFKLAHSGPKYLSSAAKNLLSSVPKEVLEVAAEKYPDGKQTLEDVAKFTETKAKVQDFVPEEKVAAVTGLTEKVQNLENNIKELEERKKTSSQALHPFMDGWIKEYQDEIDFYKKQVDKVVKSKDPTGVVEEIDDVTGLKAGQVPEVVEEKVEDITQFPETLKAKVKPTEVDLTTAKKMNASQNRYGIIKDGAEAGFIVATNPENNVVKIKGVTVNEELRGKNIAGDAYVKLGESLAKEGISLESDSFDKMEPSATRVWEKLSDKGLAVKGENSYQFKPTEVKEIKPKEIFPETLVENVLYHDSDIDNLTEFKNSDNGIFVTGDENWWQKGKNKYQVAINVKNPKIVSTPLNSTTTKEFFSNPKNNEYDAIVTTGKSGDMSKAVYAIRDASQIKVLGKNIDGKIIKSEVKPTEVKETIKTTENAIQEPSPEGVLQPEQERVRETGGERKRVEPSVKGKEIAKEGKQAKIDEKKLEEKGLSMKGLRAAETRKINEEAKKIVPETALQMAKSWLSGKGNEVSWDAIREVAGTKKKAQLNIGKAIKSEEIAKRDYAAKEEGKGMNIDEITHNIWDNLTEEQQSRIPESDVKEAVMQAIRDINTKKEAVEDLVKGVSKSEEELYWERIAAENEEIFNQELKDINDWLAEKGEKEYENEFTDEYINNLIEQYEAESKAEAQRIAEGGKGEGIEEVSRRAGGEKAKATEAELAKDYKEVIGKASKKAKENAKKDFVDRNFDSIVAKLKIQIKCPT
jgi:hypothetical protein